MAHRLEKEGHNIMTRLAGAVALPGSQKTKELKEIGKKAAMFPMKADTWALLVEVCDRARYVGAFGTHTLCRLRVEQKESVISVKLFVINMHNVSYHCPSSTWLRIFEIDDGTTLFAEPDAAIPHHPVKSIPMDLVHAMNARVAPPARPVCCLREGSCHCDGKKNVHTGTTVISSISEKGKSTHSSSSGCALLTLHDMYSEIQSTLADIATLQIHDSISPDMTETSAKMMQEESKLCSAVLA